jgi:hypothetical protein
MFKIKSMSPSGTYHSPFEPAHEGRLGGSV